MNYDVNDLEKGLHETAVNNEPPMNQRKSDILARIRNFSTNAMSSIGSVLSGNSSSMGSLTSQEDYTSPLINYDYGYWNGINDLEAASTTGSSSYHGKQHLSHCNALDAPIPTQNCSNSLPCSVRLPYTKRVPTQIAHTLTSYPSWDDASGTPPLTPDAFEDLVLSPTIPDDFYYDDNDSLEEWNQLHSLEVKAGKKPEYLDSYGAAAENTLNSNSNSIVNEDFNAPQNFNTGLPNQDNDEWYGLEYTLELSCRERHPSDSSKSGEHSRARTSRLVYIRSLSHVSISQSRESWAAIHQGTIHPFFEEEDYNRWKSWHRYLDRQEEKQRFRRSQEFKELSRDLAWLYADEMRTRDIMHWQKETYGFVSRDVKEHLQTLAEYRPDPYLPPKKHNLGWYLKRSRSVACLLELCPLPTVNETDDYYAYLDEVLD